MQITTLQSRVQRDLERALASTHPESLPQGWVRTASAAGAVHPVRAAADGYVQQIDVDALLRLAAEHGSVVTVEAMPGTHVIRGDPLVRVDALAGRLGAATRSPGVREVLVRQVDELLAAHRARVSDEVDRRVVADAGASVLDALRAEAH